MGLFFCGTAPGAYGPALRTALHSRRGCPSHGSHPWNETLVPGQSVSRMMEGRCRVNVPYVRRRRRWGTPHDRRRKQCSDLPGCEGRGPSDRRRWRQRGRRERNRRSARSDRCRWRMKRQNPVPADHMKRQSSVPAIRYQRAAACPGRPACRSPPYRPHEACPCIGFSTGISHPIMPLS